MDKNKVIEAASKLIAKGALDKAVKEYQRVLEVDPDDVRVLQKLAELYQKMQRREEAADCFEKVARTYAAQGFYLKAVALYKQVLKVVDRIEVNVRLAELYQQLGLVGDATKEWQNVAAYYEKVGDLKSSLDTLRKLVDLDPDNVAARIRLGEQYARQDQISEAVTELRRAAAYLNRNGRQDDYLRVAERISHLDPGDVQLAKELAESYLARGDSKRALAKLQICFKSNPRDLSTLQMLARAFQELGQVSKTVSVLKELARVHLDGNRTEEAKKTYAQALELSPDDAEIKASLRTLEVVAPQAQPPPPPAMTPAPFNLRPPTAPVTPQRPPTAPVAPPRPPTSPIATTPNRPTTGPIPTRPGTGPIAQPAQAAAPQSAPPPAPPTSQRVEATPVAAAAVPKLLKETEVYVKYGLHEKALEHLRKIFSVEPENVEAHEKAKALALAMNRPADAAASLSMLVRLYSARSDPRAEAARNELRAIEPNNPALQLQAAPLPPPPPAQDGEVEVEVEPEPAEQQAAAAVPEAQLEPQADQAGDDTVAEAAIVDDPEVAFAGDVPEAELETTEPVTSAAAAAPAKATPPEAQMVEEDAFASDLAEADFYIQAGLTEDARAILEAILMAEPSHAEANRRLGMLSGPIDPGPSRGTPQPPPAQGSSDDLAAELAAELASEVAGMNSAAQAEEAPIEGEALESFQVPVHEVLGEFRAKVSETVRPEDVQTHYDLGIAYKEMGLVDEAVAEFELALRHGGGVRKPDCLTMLGVCAREKGDLDRAVQWFKTGLSEAQLAPPARRALAFELATTFEAMGQRTLALEQYQTVERVEPGFRDVAARIVRLGGTISSPIKATTRPPPPGAPVRRPAGSAPPPAAAARPTATAKASPPPARSEPTPPTGSTPPPSPGLAPVAPRPAAGAPPAQPPAAPAAPAAEGHEPDAHAGETLAQRRNRKIGFV